MYYLGIDVGTSSVKALLVDEEGRVVKTASPEYEFQTPKPLWAETDPSIWWDATQFAIKELLSGEDPKNVKGVGLTGQMHGMCLLDNNDMILRPCIMWNDQRSHKECDEIAERVGKQKVIEITGNPVLPGFTALRYCGLKKMSQRFSKISRVLLPKDFIRFKLTGEYFSDVSDASGTSLLDVGKRNWSVEILEKLGWSQSWMPTVTESIEVSSKISSEASSLTGLLEGTPIVSGAEIVPHKQLDLGLLRRVV